MKQAGMISENSVYSIRITFGSPLTKMEFHDLSNGNVVKNEILTHTIAWGSPNNPLGGSLYEQARIRQAILEFIKIGLES